MHAHAHPIELHAFTSRDLRTALGTFATGVTVITTYGATDPYGMTANAFSAVSLDPPLVLVCVKSDSQGSECIRQNGVFVVNILTLEQEPISRYFASRDRMRGANAFGEIPVSGGRERRTGPRRHERIPGLLAVRQPSSGRSRHFHW